MEKINPMNQINIIIWGGTGQCKAVVPILEDDGHIIHAIFDNNISISPFKHIELYHPDNFRNWIQQQYDKSIIFKSVVAIGNPYSKERVKISNRLKNYNIYPYPVIHKTSNISNDILIPEDIQILANANIRENVKIGHNCILNCSCLVEHDCVLEDGVEIGPGAVLCGQTLVKKYSWIGANATILPNLIIGENCIIGAGAVVTKDVQDNSVIVGNPARLMRCNND